MFMIINNILIIFMLSFYQTTNTYPKTEEYDGTQTHVILITEFELLHPRFYIIQETRK